ncbi:lipopolysaccharide transport periplasmic protein LptA [Alcanivorax sp.]|uniref:lipopolysaccharide transport periplasmic protein LptA n=1 Tax=Alcanivorax sp. TaxID=1872427 RepID=UPI0032D8D49E
MNLKHRLHSTRHLAALALLVVFPLGAQAAPMEGTIQVTADNGRFEQSAGSGLYSGNVELIQGERKLFADEMRMFTQNSELVRVEATGTPVRMEEGEGLNAHAENLVYNIKARTLVLTGDAYIEHQGNTFEGAKVEYSLDSKRVDASSEGDQRVRLVIPAENQPAKSPNNASNKSNSDTPNETQSEDNSNTSPEAEPSIP